MGHAAHNTTLNAGPNANTKRYLPWIVAIALFMAQLDSTIVDTSIPAMAASLGVDPLSLKAVATKSMACADVGEADAAMAATMASAAQQLWLSFGLACGSLAAAFFLDRVSSTSPAVLSNALHHAFLTPAGLTLLSSLSFRALRAGDGDSVSRGPAAVVG
jgi:MFS family permease